MLDTPTSLPALSSEYLVSDEQRAAYARDGHVLLRGVCSSAEIAAYRHAIVDAARLYNREKRDLKERDTYGKAFLQTGNLWVHDETVKQFVCSRRFAGIAAQLMDAGGVRLYHDQALFKEPGGGLTPWHQDQQYWPLDTDNTITLWMPLVDASAEMGTMRFASGSHRTGYLGNIPISDQSEELFGRMVQERGYGIASSGAMRAGDATFHSGWTLHGAPSNSSDTAREVMTIIYYEDGTRVSRFDDPSRRGDRDAFFPGLEPGDLAESDTSPLLFER